MELIRADNVDSFSVSQAIFEVIENEIMWVGDVVNNGGSQTDQEIVKVQVDGLVISVSRT
jgi:hypothetical protein